MSTSLIVDCGGSEAIRHASAWRREGVSNPREACASQAFRELAVQPLRHPSSRLLQNCIANTRRIVPDLK